MLGAGPSTRRVERNGWRNSIEPLHHARKPVDEVFYAQSVFVRLRKFVANSPSQGVSLLVSEAAYIDRLIYKREEVRAVLFDGRSEEI